MVIRGISAIRPAQKLWRIAIVALLCAISQLAVADIESRYQPSNDAPESETNKDHAEKKTMQQIRIKRLRPADPESREVMLAARDPNLSDRRLS